MSWIFVDKESENGLRQEMRRSMRGDYRNYGGSSAMMRGGEYERGYRMGYKHAVEDWEDEDEHYRRRRDSMGRYM